MSGEKSGVWKCMRCVVPNALYINCHCHKLQFTAVYSTNEHVKGNKTGTVLTVWKAFHFT